MKLLKATELLLSVTTGVGEGVKLGAGVAVGVASPDFATVESGFALGAFLVSIAGVATGVAEEVGVGVPDSVEFVVVVIDGTGEGVGRLSGEGVDCLNCGRDPSPDAALGV